MIMTRLLKMVLLVSLLLVSIPHAKSAVFEVSAPKQCVAIRGNGPLITAHFASMARLLEEEGLIDGGMGGSSGSITLFLYESILANPELTNCADCDSRKIALRAALLMKSIFGYLELVKDSDEGTAIMGFKESLASQIATQSAPYPVLLKRISAFLSNPEIRDLVSPEFIAFAKPKTKDRALADYRANEALQSILHFGSFDGSDKRVLYRPGIFNFSEVASRIGRLGDFLAGRGAFYNGNGVREYLDRCALSAKGLDWIDFSKEQPSCRDQAMRLMKAYRVKRIKVRDLPDSRIKDAIGRYGHFIATNAVLEHPEWLKVEFGKNLYLNNDPAFTSYQLNIFDELHFGYFGKSSDTKRIAANPKGYADIKTQKARTYSGLNWQALLSRSPAEPGLASVLEGLYDGSPVGSGATAAGWVDLAPVLQLRNMGCEKVTYITRRGNDSAFAQGVASLFGISPEQKTAMYDLKNLDSSYSRSIREADSILCTNWDSFSPKDLKAIVADAYHAPLENAAQSKYLGCGGSQ
jgi:hypothetical protein